MFDDCVIMAGGTGTRLWPASRSAMPKQFLPVSRDRRGAERTFFHAALERAFAAVKHDTGQVLVITGEAHAPRCAAIRQTLSPHEKKRLTIIPEPAAKNTAPAVACGLYYTDFRYRERRTMLVLTSDHLITPLETFRQDAETAAAAAREGSLVVFGIPPRGPETGYGYIEIESAESRTAPLCPVASFREKPDKAAAQGFLDTGRFYWNSGMFAFSTHALKDAFRACAPDIARLFETLAPPTFAEYREGTETAHPWPALREAYTRVTGISFDYAVAEKLAARGRGMVMARARFDWRDVGCWDEYAAVLGDAGSSAEVYESGSASCFVDSPVPVALCGVEDLIVAVSPGENGGAGAVLVAKKGETQKVRDIVERIKLAGRTKLL